LVDKGIAQADPLDCEGTLVAARAFLPDFLNLSTSSIPPEVTAILWERLREVRFELLTGDMLAGIYERGLLSEPIRRQFGIHYTPASMRRFIWNLVSEDL